MLFLELDLLILLGAKRHILRDRKPYKYSIIYYYLVGMVWNKGLKGVQKAWNKDKKCKWVTEKNLKNNPMKNPKTRKKQSESLIKYFEIHENPFKGRNHKKSSKIKIGLANKGKLLGDKNPSKRPEIRELLSIQKTEWWKQFKKTREYKNFCKNISENKERSKKISKKLFGIPKSKESIEKIKEIIKIGYANGSIKQWCKNKTKETDIRLKRAGGKISKIKIELYKKHPEKHPNYILSKNRNNMKKSTENIMYNILLNLNLKFRKDFFYNYNVSRYWLDFAFPNIKLDIETDGEHWHKDKEKDLSRTENLNKLGWSVIRFTDKELRNTLEIKSRINEILFKS